jgi:hypothetical protein
MGSGNATRSDYMANGESELVRGGCGDWLAVWQRRSCVCRARVTRAVADSSRRAPVIPTRKWFRLGEGVWRAWCCMALLTGGLWVCCAPDTWRGW